MKEPCLHIRLRCHRSFFLAVTLVVTMMAIALLLGSGWNARTARAQPIEQAHPLAPAIISQSIPGALRQYYLTTGFYYGSQADGNNDSGAGVCAAGYHFASLWEIIDTSNLRYNINQGDSRTDSGKGPPADKPGWVRTGYSNDDGTTPGQANCGVWDQTVGYGTTVRLPDDWSDASQQDIHIWDASVADCYDDQQVWCVADKTDGPGTCTQPEPIFCGQQVSGDTTGLPSHIYQYSCSPWNESGPEMIYLLSLPAGDTYAVTVTLSGLASGVDLDLFFMNAGDCYTGTCQAFHNDMLQLTSMNHGAYYIAVDGYDNDPTDDVYGDAGAYTLEVNCSKSFVFLPLVRK